MIAPAILEHYPDLNEAQRSIVGHVDGPLLVVAGPGSGKTYSIVLRALNLFLLRRAAPGEVILCTYTEKAAFEMRDRMAASARKVGYKGDLSELTVSTIHGLCSRLLQRYRHKTPLGHGFEMLDELTQLLFLFEYFDDTIGQPGDGIYLERWKTRWTAIEGARSCVLSVRMWNTAWRSGRVRRWVARLWHVAPRKPTFDVLGNFSRVFFYVG